MKEQIFNTIDECIKAAYQHVKETNCKVDFIRANICPTYDENYKIYNQTNRIGLISSDDYYFLITIEDNYKVQDKPLCNSIINHNISIVDFINKQLLVFL